MPIGRFNRSRAKRLREAAETPGIPIPAPPPPHRVQLAHGIVRVEQLVPGAEHRAVRFEHEGANLWVTVSQDTRMGQVEGERSIIWGPAHVGWPSAQVTPEAVRTFHQLVGFAMAQAREWEADAGKRHPAMDRV